MKIKNKGKVHPSPSSSAAANGNKDTDVFSVLKLLPAAILTLASVLSLEDREVLAYMITRSMKTATTSSPNPNSNNLSKKSSKKASNLNTHFNNNHKVPNFECDCFDCYTSYWFRWDSSPNRELIHHVIEAFEDHLTKGEQSKKSIRSKRREKSGRRVTDKAENDALCLLKMASPSVNDESSVAVVSPPDDDVSPVSTPGRAADGEQAKGNEGVAEDVQVVETENAAAVAESPADVNNRRGLARKVLPDVLGIFNSRMWSLWGPNV